MALVQLGFTSLSSTTLFVGQVHPLLAVSVTGVAGIAGVHRWVIGLWATLEELVAWLKALMQELKDKIDDTISALLVKHATPHEQNEWCLYLEADSPDAMNAMLNRAKTRLNILDSEWLNIKEESFPTWYMKAKEFSFRAEKFKLEGEELRKRVTDSSARIMGSVYEGADSSSESTSCESAAAAADASRIAQTSDGQRAEDTREQTHLAETLCPAESKMLSELRQLWVRHQARLQRGLAID